MDFRFCSFASGSSGNCYLVMKDNVGIIIDTGISGKKIIEAISEIDYDTDKIKGIMITHEHIDHVKSIGIISKKMKNANVYATAKTWEIIEEKVSENKRIHINAGEKLEVFGIEVTTFRLSHDAADPVGYSFENNGKKISIVTDTGIITEEIFDKILDSDILVIEANYEENLLNMSRYPWKVKQRIKSDIGHLSNEDTGEVLCEILKKNPEKERQILLAHLSSENNFPEMAYRTIKNMICEKQLNKKRKMKIDIILKERISRVYKV